MKTPRHFSKLISLFTAVMLLLSLSAAAIASDAGMFQVVITDNFSGMDPLRTNDRASTYVNAQIYETLYFINREGTLCYWRQSAQFF